MYKFALILVNVGLTPSKLFIFFTGGFALAHDHIFSTKYKLL